MTESVSPFTCLNYMANPVEITLHNERDSLITAFGKATLTERYALPGESFQQMFGRVAGYYADDTAHAQRLYDYMSLHWFMPSTPVLSNGGTNRGYPISCFLNSIPDSIEGINAGWAENVMLAAKGGGIGTYWSGVRSIDENVGNVGKTSGIIPFIKVQDSLTLAISQGQLRRGSAAVYLDIHHPEVEEFIDLRREIGDPNRRCLNIHHGVNVTDAFMGAVEAGKSFDLISPKDGSVRKTVDARTLWQKILTARLEKGEPYIVYIDTVNRNRPEVYKRNGHKVLQSNLCSEVSLTTGLDSRGFDRTAVCCLSSVNASKMDEWIGNKLFVRDVLVFLDNVMSDFILKTKGVPGFEKARYSAARERSLGLGVMGFHSLLQAKGIPYESAIASSVNRRIFGFLAEAGAEANEAVALERGPCPDAQDVGLTQRWSHMFAVAPTASISIIAGTTSPGIDPMPANTYVQKTLSGTYVVRNQDLDAVIRRYGAIKAGYKASGLVSLEDVRAEVDAFAAEAWKIIERDDGSAQGLDFLTRDEKDTFKTHMELDQRWVIEHAATRAPFIDQMASNNLAMPADVDKKELHQVHMMAWKKGVPSLYYLRSKSLLRGGKMSHTAGEMPQPGPAHDVVLRDRGEVVDLFSGNNDLEVCLACS